MERTKKRSKFWDKEYLKAERLAIARTPSEDLQKFCRFLERHYGRQYLHQNCKVLDAGCGNGRNLIFLAQEYGMHGLGIDSSLEGIEQARKHAKEVEVSHLVTFQKGSISDPLPLPDHTTTLVLDMMVSHVLKSYERDSFLKEIVRVLRTDGWLFFKTFLLDEDRNAKRLLRDNPGSEEGSYIHPDIGVEEHVFTEHEIAELLEPYFILHKIAPSHKHLKYGQANKRRSVSVYAQVK
ncbi:class I SAM-dependent methyltransferase [bacterium]|nr:class I SAM-dependent methyltransferase [bacterium]